jgi:hypothetical protein
MTERELLGLWWRLARASEKVHYKIGSRLAWCNSLLTAVVVVASTVVGSSLFSLLSKHTSNSWKLGLAVASVVSAVLVAVQKSLGLGDAAEKNRSTGSGWQRVLNKCTTALTIPDGDPRLTVAIAELEKMNDEVVANSPQIPERAFKNSELAEIYAELERYARSLKPPVG